MILNNFYDLVSEDKTLNIKIIELRKKIENEFKIPYESQDARMVALDNIQKELITTGMWFRAYLSLLESSLDTKGKLNDSEFLKQFDSELNMEDTVELLSEQKKRSMIVQIHFSLDNLFQNIRRIWETPDKSFKKNYEYIIKKTINEDEQEKIKVLFHLLSSIRNTLHNNGIHRHKGFSINVNTMIYHFEENKKIECASWAHVLNVVEELIDVLSKILFSDKVDWRQFIKDDFASGH